MSKVIRDCIVFRSVIGPKNSCPFLNQSDAKLKPIMTWSSAFSRALGSLFVFTFEFSLALKGIFLTSNRPLWLLWQFSFFSSHFRVGLHWYCKEKFLFCFFVRVKGLTPNSQSLSFKKFMAGGAENWCLDFGGETLKNWTPDYLFACRVAMLVGSKTLEAPEMPQILASFRFASLETILGLSK